MADGCSSVLCPTTASIKSLSTQLRCWDMLVGLASVTLAIFGMVGAITKFSLSTILLEVYCVIFSGVQLLQEVNCGWTKRKLISWWGFLFSWRGRASFFVFIATLNLASNWWGGYVSGGLNLALALYHGLVMAVNASFKENCSCRDDCTLLYSAGESEVGNFMKKNPEMTKKVVSAAVANPSVMRAATSSVADNAFAV